MLLRRSALGLCLLFGAAALFGQGGEAVEFVHVTDTHVVNLAGVAEPMVVARNHFADGEARLKDFLSGDRLPSAASFALITGDLIDAYTYAGQDGKPVYGQIDAFARAVRGSRIPVFLLLGNHDIQHYGLSSAGKPAGDHSVAGEARAAWIRAMPSFQKGTYYAIERQAGATRYLILALDDGYSAAGSRDGAGRRMAHEQLYWIRRQVETHPGAVVILAMHIPLGEDDASAEIKSAAAGARSPVLILAGHNHRDGIENLMLGGTPAVQVRTAALGYGKDNWRRIRLEPGRVLVYATGKPDQVDRTVDIDQ